MSSSSPLSAEQMLGQVTREGDNLVKRFLGAQKDLESARRTVNSAECELINAERDLAKWLAPPDLKPDEKIGVWIGDSLLLVEMVKRESYAVGGDNVAQIDYDYKVTVRTRGKNHWRLT